MLYLTKPENFKSTFEVVSCFIQCRREILLLHRQDHKPQGDTWGVVAGKVDAGETNEAALFREVFEETKLKLSPESLKYFKTTYVKYREYDFVYHIYHYQYESKPEVVIDMKDHKAYCWITPRDALCLPLIEDEDVCIKLFYKIP